MSQSTESTDAPYDVNFCFPVYELEDDRVLLTPFLPSVHAEPFFAATAPHPELYTYLPFGPFPSAAAFVSDFLAARIQPDPHSILFAVFAKPPSADASADGSATLAGMIGLLNTSPPNLSTELGFLLTLPRFQGAPGITPRAVRLLLRHAFGALRLRRVQWRAHALNARSVRAARRAGFRWEGVARCERVLPRGKVGDGRGVPKGAAEGEGPSRDTAVLGMGWDDWEEMVAREAEAAVAEAEAEGK